MEVKGRVVFIGQTQQVSEKFSKREIVVEIGDQYPQEVLLEANQKACELLDKVNVGSEVTIHFNLRGRSWTNPQGEKKWFNTLQVWKIEGGNQMQPTQQQTQEEEQDLPF